MHQRAVLCTMCGGKFFPASLAFHQKACARKQNFVLLPCPYCDVEVPKPELNTHIASSCKKAPKSAQTSPGASTVPHDANNAADAPENGIFDEAGRMCCPVCKRWFNQDRIGKHQAICRKLEEKNRRKRPIFDSFQQRKFDPLVQRSDIEERHAKASGSGTADANALKAARSYYTAERLQQTEEGHKPPLLRKDSVSQASKKSKAPGGTAEKVPEKTTPATRRAAGTGSTHSKIGQSPCNEEHVSTTASRATTAPGDRRASGTSTSGARKSVANSTAVAARGEGAVSKRNACQPTSARNKSTPSVEQANRTGRSLPPRVGDTRKACNRHIERSGGGGGGGAILETNEASIDNTLAYPNYPANWNEITNKQEFARPSFATTRNASHPNRIQQGLNVSGRGTPGGNGGILATNETSADNPLAFPYR